jgi:hypothetical protein
MSGETKEKKDEKKDPANEPLEGMDYLALIIASLETILIPFVIIIVVFLAVLFLLPRL